LERNYAAGQKAAEFLVPLVNYKGKIAVLYTVGAENSESVFRVLKTGVNKMRPKFPS